MLYKTEVRNEFDRVVDPSEPKGLGPGPYFGWLGRVPLAVWFIAGTVVALLMVVIGIDVLLEYYTKTYSSESELYWGLALIVFGAIGFTLLLLRVLHTKRQRRQR